MWTLVLFASFGFCICATKVEPNANNTITDEVFFDIKIVGKANESWTGRFIVGIFGKACPITAFNFVALAKGYQHGEEKWHYKENLVNRIVPDFLVQMGDVLYLDGRGGRSVYAPFFIDENFIHSHKAAGYVAMANSGVDSNASQFYVTLSKARWLDNRNVIFGKIMKGMDVIKRLAEAKVDENGFPNDKIFISDCGILPLKVPYDLTEEDLNRDGDTRPGPIAPDTKKDL